MAEDNFDAVDPLAQVSKGTALALFDDEPDTIAASTIPKTSSTPIP